MHVILYYVTLHYTHTHRQTYIHITHTYTQTHATHINVMLCYITLHTHTHTDIHTHRHTHTHTCMLRYVTLCYITHTYRHTYTQTHTYTDMYVMLHYITLHTHTYRASLRRCGAQMGTISVGPDSQSTCTKVNRIGRGAQLGAVGPFGLRSAQHTYTQTHTHAC